MWKIIPRIMSLLAFYLKTKEHQIDFVFPQRRFDQGTALIGYSLKY